MTYHAKLYKLSVMTYHFAKKTKDMAIKIQAQ